MEDVLNSFDASHNILNIFHPCEGTERTTSWIKTFCLRSFYSDKKFLNLGLNRICKTFKHSPSMNEEKITRLFLSDPIPIIALSHSSMWDLTHVTLACEDSCNLSKSCNLSLSFLQNLAKPNMFLKFGPNFEATVFSRLWSYVVDAGTKPNP